LEPEEVKERGERGNTGRRPMEEEEWREGVEEELLEEGRRT
jgi:hypothetical protein